ncbi:MAG: AmmeMemoRadiSam system radical SAM enzyme [Clostridia bacterium]|nr:AmmeMemoRadiSam system radical SAM enzyme [Clostridia bacterium]
MKQASYFISMKNNAVKCKLCPHECEIMENQSGICGVRINMDGVLYTKTYNQISSIAIDPIEKKPIRRYKPNTKILSVGTFGCNFKCGFCQNYHISQLTPELEEMSSNELLDISDRQKESIGIAFTYNEPTIWYEYIEETARKNKKDTILVTNGFINKEPLLNLLPYINAMNIDLKSINPHFYERVCKGKLEPVMETIKTAHEQTHVELTFLSIPDLNDSMEEMKELSEWIASVDKNIPLHIIPFRPMYKMNDTPYQTHEKIDKLKSIAFKYLSFVY